MRLDAPFPWFGGKRKVASEVWARFGDVPNYVEPFFGSGAVLFGRPDTHTGSIETVNDRDGYVANFWRSIARSPDETAAFADYPVNENDLHARHIWLVSQRDVLARLEGDPDWHDPKIAGWWVWGISCWIGGGFCSGDGPWQSVDGKLVHLGDQGRGVNRKRVHLGDQGRGVNRQLVHLGSQGQGVNRQLVHLGSQGQGVNRQLVHLGSQGQGVNRLAPWFRALADRLRFVRVCAGDWSRVCGPSPTFKHGLTGVFLDPPYADTADRDPDLYRVDCLQIAHEVRAWAIANGDNPLLRIAICGYEGEHEMPESWSVHEWNAGQGYSAQALDGSSNSGRRERIWFSPHCLSTPQPTLWDWPGLNEASA